MTVKLRYKVFANGLRSRYDNSAWVIGVWRDVGRGTLEPCMWGFHCSDHPISALRYIPDGAIIGLVETAGAHANLDDKSAWRRMRVVRAYRWKAVDAKALNVFLRKLAQDQPYPRRRSRTKDALNRDTAYKFRALTKSERDYSRPLEQWILRRIRANRITKAAMR